MPRWRLTVSLLCRLSAIKRKGYLFKRKKKKDKRTTHSGYSCISIYDHYFFSSFCVLFLPPSFFLVFWLSCGWKSFVEYVWDRVIAFAIASSQSQMFSQGSDPLAEWSAQCSLVLSVLCVPEELGLRAGWGCTVMVRFSVSFSAVLRPTSNGAFSPRVLQM